jgi:hypothetical protein
MESEGTAILGDRRDGIGSRSDRKGWLVPRAVDEREKGSSGKRAEGKRCQSVLI